MRRRAARSRQQRQVSRVGSAVPDGQLVVVGRQTSSRVQLEPAYADIDADTTCCARDRATGGQSAHESGRTAWVLWEIEDVLRGDDPGDRLADQCCHLGSGEGEVGVGVVDVEQYHYRGLL